MVFILDGSSEIGAHVQKVQKIVGRLKKSSDDHLTRGGGDEGGGGG